jgi:ubiquitin-protein ligase E3 C
MLLYRFWVIRAEPQQPLDTPTDPLHPELVSLTLAPFIVLQKAAPEYLQALENFFVTVFLLPLYPNRLPKTELPRLALGIPLRLIHQVSIASILASIRDNSTAINLLANLIAFYPSRYPALNKQPFETYLKLISDILSRLPVGCLEPRSTVKQADKWVGDSDSDDDHRVAPSASSIPLPPLDPKTAVRLRNLHSASHLQSLLTASARLPSLWDSVIKYLVNLCAIWPSKRDSILTILSVNNGAMVIKQLWRETVRSTPLGKSDNPRELTNPNYASDWPSLVLLTELYNQMLLTMGDDEFFSLPSKGGGVVARNPLTRDEVLLLSKKLLNIAFVLYWTEEQADIKNSVVPGLRLTWDGVRDRATKCLQAIHARQ